MNDGGNVEVISETTGRVTDLSSRGVLWDRERRCRGVKGLTGTEWKG
jgi:hypothetical protein